MDDAMGRLMFIKSAHTEPTPARRMRSDLDRAGSLRREATIALDGDHLEEARRLYTQCIPLFESGGALRDAADTSLTLSRLCIRMGDHVEGISCCDRAIAIFRKLNARA
jgi:hypothetical protein